MEIAFTDWIPVSDASSVGAARRMAISVASRLGFDETQSGTLALLATEASRNILVHGGGGQVVFSGIQEDDTTIARILAIDKGKGIANMAEAMCDGFSTAGTMGGGLGAMKRMATKLDIFTGRNGTVVMIELRKPDSREIESHRKLQIAGFAVPYPRGARMWRFMVQPSDTPSHRDSACRWPWPRMGSIRGH
jgi:anti-sigma regulatory factor (Ser/Thr protein kinase)